MYITLKISNDDFLPDSKIHKENDSNYSFEMDVQSLERSILWWPGKDPDIEDLA